ncbi:YggS family pyridoxal phosphate-dependent enzyme [Clostridium carnis]
MNIEENIKAIIQKIPEDVKLVAVSKTKPLEDLEKAYEFGIRDFGENKVQELIYKEEIFHKDVKWHLIGNLQTNKVKYIVNKVFLIHSLSSIKLLHKIESEFGKGKAIANVLIQINIGREDSKGGLLVEELDEIIKEIEKCKFVKVKGLMAIIPKGEEESNRYYFKEMKNIFNKIKGQDYSNISMEILSMGMSKDFEVAISEGANLVRIGEGIFGSRK